jgi:hypothetical protein
MSQKDKCKVPYARYSEMCMIHFFPSFSLKKRMTEKHSMVFQVVGWMVWVIAPFMMNEEETF